MFTPLNIESFNGAKLSNGVDACPVQKSKILYGVFPEDQEEAAEMLADEVILVRSIEVDFVPNVLTFDTDWCILII